MKAFALVMIVSVAGFACAAPPQLESLTDVDRAAIKSLDSGFVAGWLADDTAAVLRSFASDAILLPPNSSPIIGIPGIRAYWWPNDGTHTRITGFDRRISEIEGTRRLAFVRGTGTLTWVYSKAGQATAQSSKSIDLLIVAPDSTGRWHVIRQMWGSLP